MPFGTVKFVEISPGNYRAYGYPEKRFIPMEEGLRRLRTTIAGYHGHRGQLQPYEAIAQVLGPGKPTPAHRWWITEEEIPEPTEDMEFYPNQQLVYESIFQIGDQTYKRTFGGAVGEPPSSGLFTAAYDSISGSKAQVAADLNVSTDQVVDISGRWTVRTYHRVGYG